MSAISFGRPFVPSLPPSHTGNAHHPAGLTARHGPQGPDTGAIRQPIAMPKPAGGGCSPSERKPASPYPLPECPHLPGMNNRPRLEPAKMPMVCAPPEYRDPGYHLPTPTFPNYYPDTGFSPKPPDGHQIPGDHGFDPFPWPDDCVKPGQPGGNPWFVPPDWNKPRQPDCLPWPCGDDTSRYSVTPTANPTWHVLDTGPCGPDEVKIVIHENGSATVTVNGTDYDYNPHFAQDLRVIVDENDNVQIQDRRSYDDRMREPQPVKIKPRS